MEYIQDIVFCTMGSERLLNCQAEMGVPSSLLHITYLGPDGQVLPRPAISHHLKLPCNCPTLVDMAQLQCVRCTLDMFVEVLYLHD